MKAYTVTFTDAPSKPGRHNRSTYKSACVIAKTAVQAVSLAESYRVKHWPKMHVEEVRLDDNLVIM